MMWLWIVLFALMAGYACTQTGSRLMRTLVWLLPVINVFSGYYLSSTSQPGKRMLILILLLFLGMKAVSTVYRYPSRGKLSLWQWLAFSLCWPGMDPQPFEQLGRKQKVTADRSLLYKGALSATSGLALLYLLAWLLDRHWLSPYIAGLLSFIPFIMIFHIGIGHIGVVLWAGLGIKVIPLMDAPWRSGQLGAFWGQRWNTAFIQMTRTTLFIPFARRRQPQAALLLSFLISGIFHEVALTLPAGGGYGRPLLYFILQAVLVLAERRYPCRSPLQQRLYTWLCLLLPFPLLLPPAFLREVILPLLQALPA